MIGLVTSQSKNEITLPSKSSKSGIVEKKFKKRPVFNTMSKAGGPLAISKIFNGNCYCSKLQSGHNLFVLILRKLSTASPESISQMHCLGRSSKKSKVIVKATFNGCMTLQKQKKRTGKIREVQGS